MTAAQHSGVCSRNGIPNLGNLNLYYSGQYTSLPSTLEGQTLSLFSRLFIVQISLKILSRTRVVDHSLPKMFRNVRNPHTQGGLFPSILSVCRITGRAGRRGPSEIISSTRLPIRPSRRGSQEATPATSEFQMTLLAAVQGSGNCYSEIAPQHPPTRDSYLHQTCLLTVVRFGTLEHCRKTQCFHKCACQD